MVTTVKSIADRINYYLVWNIFYEILNTNLNVTEY